MKSNKRKKFFANKLHKEIFFVVFFASIVPAAIVTVLLYYLIFGIMANQLAIPEAIAYNVIPAAKKVTTILAVSVPISIFIILISALKISHKIVGPFDRITRELDENLKGKRKGHIILRKKDKFRPLVDRINKLLDKN